MQYVDKLFGTFQRLQRSAGVPRHRHRSGDRPNASSLTPWRPGLGRRQDRRRRHRLFRLAACGFAVTDASSEQEIRPAVPVPRQPSLVSWPCSARPRMSLLVSRLPTLASSLPWLVPHPPSLVSWPCSARPPMSLLVSRLPTLASSLPWLVPHPPSLVSWPCSARRPPMSLLVSRLPTLASSLPWLVPHPPSLVSWPCSARPPMSLLMQRNSWVPGPILARVPARECPRGSEGAGTPRRPSSRGTQGQCLKDGSAASVLLTQS